MNISRNEEPSLLQKSHTIRWEREDFDQLERATQVLADREHLNLTVTDLIRRGALREAEDILADVPEAA